MVTNGQEILSGGSTGLVSLLPNGNVRKHAYPDAQGQKQSMHEIEKEFEIYQILPSNDRILKYYAYHEKDGLELEYIANGSLRDYVKRNATASVRTRIQWATDAAAGVSLLHQHDIVHCDISPRNLLVDDALRVKVIDFSGSSIAGRNASAVESTRFFKPRAIEEDPTICTDLFALGSTIYEIMTDHQPYHDKISNDVQIQFQANTLPDVSKVPCGHIVIGCWSGEITTATEVKDLLEAELTLSLYNNRLR